MACEAVCGDDKCVGVVWTGVEGKVDYVYGLAVEDVGEEGVTHVVERGVFEPLWGDCFFAGHEDADLWLGHIGRRML